MRYLCMWKISSQPTCSPKVLAPVNFVPKGTMARSVLQILNRPPGGRLGHKMDGQTRYALEKLSLSKPIIIGSSIYVPPYGLGQGWSFGHVRKVKFSFLCPEI